MKKSPPRNLERLKLVKHEKFIRYTFSFSNYIVFFISSITIRFRLYRFTKSNRYRWDSFMVFRTVRNCYRYFFS